MQNLPENLASLKRTCPPPGFRGNFGAHPLLIFPKEIENWQQSATRMAAPATGTETEQKRTTPTSIRQAIARLRETSQLTGPTDRCKKTVKANVDSSWEAVHRYNDIHASYRYYMHTLVSPIPTDTIQKKNKNADRTNMDIHISNKQQVMRLTHLKKSSWSTEDRINKCSPCGRCGMLNCHALFI